MERKEFLRSLGVGAAFALTFPCLNGCTDYSGNDDVPLEDREDIPSGVDFTIDLSSSEGQQLANNGSYIIKDSVVVVKNLEGSFVAASQVCSHQQTPNVTFLSNSGDGVFGCSTHGARFDQAGQPLNSVTSNPLKIFNTELSGEILRVFES